MAEATLTVATEVPVENQFKAKLSAIDNHFVENSRDGIGSAEDLKELIDNIRINGQLQAVIGSYAPEVGPDGVRRIRLVGGFRRFEALCQMALKKLVKEYNDAHMFKPGDENHVDLLDETSRLKMSTDTAVFAPDPQKPTEQTSWAARYKAVMDSAEIKVGTVDVPDEVTAICMNLSENTARSNLSTAELCKTISRLLDMGMKQKAIGNRLGKSEGKISQCVKIGVNPAFLRDFFSKQFAKLKLPEEAMEKMKKDAETGVAELERRTAMNIQDPKAIQFSLLRDFAYTVQTEANGLTLNATLKLLKDLVRLNDKGEVTETPTMDYGVFKIQIQNAKAESKLPETPAATAAPGAEAVKTPAGTTTSDIAGQQKAGVSTGNPPTAATSPTPAAVAVTNEQSTDAALIAAANDQLSPDELLAGTATATGVVPEGTPAAKPGVSAEMSGKTSEAPAGNYKLMTPAAVENLAVEYVKFVKNNDGITPIDAATFLLAAVSLYDSLGLSAMTEKMNTMYGEFIEKLNKYYTEMEKFIATKGTDAEKAAFVELKPAIPTNL